MRIVAPKNPANDEHWRGVKPYVQRVIALEFKSYLPDPSDNNSVGDDFTVCIDAANNSTRAVCD